ncbi:probable LRR receptor-like serine/threonine-protein kinase At1g06840 isoform X2 [Cryptomeria japonica]|uniref:probable LRR receptor-like serine/threonine-protein kinase At1g06840 isoform X2 n=1 Tax=Cryptomeria japonica TaxID=3369 RepID=UPI0027DA9DBA|nr:probable LRR receptor-like serine/threonine-protein kinase At1g06840 isoform X2 [Cryptomeria japonica]
MFALSVKALQKIRQSLGDPFNNLKSWKDGDPCNTPWKGVICSVNASTHGYLHVTQLELLTLKLTGQLAPEIGQLQQLKILDFMWNNITGTIPKEIGNITTLELLLLNGNHISGSLPEEIGYLPKLDRIQIDQNNISGPLPVSFANLNTTKHFHMNNNSISGQIPKEFARLPKLVHLLLDNNNLSGELPPEIWSIPNLLILQLDNNKLINGTIPSSYTNMNKLLKLSLRNCSLQGSIPDFSSIPFLGYLDLSYNSLTGGIPSTKLSENMTTVDLSHNKLNGTIPSSFADLPQLQRLSLDNNELSGAVPAGIGLNVSFTSNSTLLLDFQNNSISTVNASTIINVQNITMRLEGNPVCRQDNSSAIARLCGNNGTISDGESSNRVATCKINSCAPPDFEYIPDSDCFCVAPFEVGYRLKSPGFTYFTPYLNSFEEYLTSGLSLNLYQLFIEKYVWEEGPRLAMNLKFFPPKNQSVRIFNDSEVQRIRQMFAEWKIIDSDIFGPYEWINITLTGPYKRDNEESSGGSGLSKGALAGIVVGVIFGTTFVSSVIVVMVMKRHIKHKNIASKRKLLEARKRVKVAGVKDFDFDEMALATNNFNTSMQVGQGGYGKVYKGILADGMVVAIKRAQEGSLQGEKEFSTEIELLSRVHHRNLVSLVGYCDDQGEQMLVYEYMANGTLRDHLSGSKKPLNFAQRLHIALGAARGILYLHNEANPPIFHRDIKATNILLDHRFNARVADFGLSRLAPLPDLEGSAPGHVSTVVKGTPGYLDPEYFLTHKLTDKSDVYSFGVVLLELLTGMHPISHGKNIVREVNMAYQSGMMISLIDLKMGSYPSESLEPFATLALSCCKDETDARPSMAEVVHQLEQIFKITPGVDTTPIQSSEMDALMHQKQSMVQMTSQNPYLSSNVMGSELLSGTIPDIAPR